MLPQHKIMRFSIWSVWPFLPFLFFLCFNSEDEWRTSGLESLETYLVPCNRSESKQKISHLSSELKYRKDKNGKNGQNGHIKKHLYFMLWEHFWWTRTWFWGLYLSKIEYTHHQLCTLDTYNHFYAFGAPRFHPK